MKTRVLTSALLLLTGLVGAIVPQAAAAGQAVPIKLPTYGYVWGNQPTTADYLAQTGYELNSTGGKIRIQRFATGRYQVRFYGMGRDGGIAHAGAYGSNHRCAVLSYYDWGDDEYLNIRCLDVDGNAVDTRFVANFTSRKLAGVSFGYLRNDDPTPPWGYVPPAATSHDGAGEQIQVYRTSVGKYWVYLGAFAADVATGQWSDGFLAATVAGSADGTCHPHGSMPSAPEYIYLTCADLDGQWTDTRFTLTYARDRSLLGSLPRASAMAQVIDDPVLEGWTNSAGGQPTVTELGTGHFQVAFPDIGAPYGHAYGTLMNTSPMYCNVSVWFRIGTTQYVRFRCYDPAIGEPHPVHRINLSFLP